MKWIWMVIVVPAIGSIFPALGLADRQTEPSTPVTYMDVKPILDASCLRCHSGRRPAKRLDLSNYASIMASRTVRPGEPNKSVLYNAIRTGAMPPKSPMKAEDQDRIRQWIADGAREKPPEN